MKVHLQKQIAAARSPVSRLDRHEKVKFTLEVNVRLAVMREIPVFRLQTVADGRNEEG